MPLIEGMDVKQIGVDEGFRLYIIDNGMYEACEWRKVFLY